MNRPLTASSLLVSLLLLNCSPKAPQTEPTESAPPAAGEPTATEPTAAEPAAKAEPSAEEVERAQALAKLEADRAKMRAAHQAELARLTPELRARAQALADKSYPTGRAAIQAALAAESRKPGSAARDGARHPLETLAFFDFSPTKRVLEYGPGEGWYTEILAPALAKKGQLTVTNTDPKGPPEERATYYGERVQLLLESSPELYGKVQTVTFDAKAPDLGLESTIDLALVIRGLHGMQNSGVLDTWLRELHQALVPKGVLGIVQHRAAPNAVAEESSKQGYLPEAWVIAKVEAAGFSLAGKSEINANPKDTKDYPSGVWTLPPSLTLGDQDREKYIAIGESDRMTLKFVKK